MKIVTILFIFFAFTVCKLMVIGATTDDSNLSLPTLTQPNITFKTLGACDSVGACIGYLADVIYNIGAGIIYGALLIINLVVYFFSFIFLVGNVLFTGVDGAPDWLNAIMTLPFLAGFGIIVFKLIRKGSSSD